MVSDRRRSGRVTYSRTVGQNKKQQRCCKRYNDREPLEDETQRQEHGEEGGCVLPPEGKRMDVKEKSVIILLRKEQRT
jgi:hypothetical protein